MPIFEEVFTYKCNTHEFWSNVILFQSLWWDLYLKLTSKPTIGVTIFASITLAVEHIFQVLAQYSWVLSQYLQVCHNTCKYWAGEYTPKVSIAHSMSCCLRLKLRQLSKFLS